MNLSPARRDSLFPAFTPFEQWVRNFFDGNTATLPAAAVLPKADIAETEKELLVSIELPGVNENDVKVVIEGDDLVVSGERKARTEEKDKHWHRVEATYGAFERRFELPARVSKDPATIKATAHKGIIEIRVPKVEPRTPAKIPVKAM